MNKNLDSILEMYIFETNSLLENLDKILLKVEGNPNFDKEFLDESFRIIHNIKGSSAMMQFESISRISHKIEDLLCYIREKPIEEKYKGDFINLLFKASDFIKGEIVKIEKDLEFNITVEELEIEILNLLKQMDEVKSKGKETNDKGVKTPSCPRDIRDGKKNLIRVDACKIDKLLDLVGDLVTKQAIVESHIDDRKLSLESLKKSNKEMTKLTQDLQNLALSLTRVPISEIFQKMQRLIRDMGKELGKDVDLKISGGDLEIDKAIGDSISDPIMHLVRNAMDHGIESEEERIKAGKDKKGTISLAAYRTGDEIHISVEDDGRGFKTDKILAKARDKGLANREQGQYTKKDIYQFLMVPGFSTNENITEYSGRGVGMDVVRSNVEKIGGRLVLDSNEGLGSKITFKIPLY